MAIEVISFVGTSAAWTALSTADKAYYTDPGGSNYTSITAWAAAFGNATSGDLVTNNESATAELNNQTFTEKVVLAGWTCDATRHPTIRARAGAEYNYSADTGVKIEYSGLYSWDGQASGFLHIAKIKFG